MLHTRSGKKSFDYRLLFQMWNGDLNNLLYILKSMDVKNVVDNFGMTLLHHAVNAGNEYAVKYLVDQGCKVDVLDNCGNTPLMDAVKCKHQSVISILLESNADILLCGEGKENPLKMILAPEFVSIVDAVCEEFFDKLRRKFATDSQQIAKILMNANCSLPRAMDFKDILITEYMLNKGYTVHDRDPKNGYTALHNAVDNVDSLNVKLLLERGADIFAENRNGYTPSDYYIAGQEESYEVLVILLHHDTTLSIPTTIGYELAANVFHSGQIKEVEAMLRYNFNFEDSSWNVDGECLLHSIVKNRNPGVMDKLEGRKFDVHARDSEGKTVLWHAAFYSNPSSSEFLLKHGANPNDKNNEGETVFILCFEKWTSGNCEDSPDDIVKCVELFLEYGADILCEDSNSNPIFDISLNHEQFPFIKPVISQLAIMEANGRRITKNILRQMRYDKRYKKYFNRCKRKIDALQRTMINDTVCLFQFLSEPEEKLVKYAQNDESAEKLKRIISGEPNPDIFFVKLLQKRVKNILETAKLRDEAASAIFQVSGCGNGDVIERIVSLLDKPSLENMCRASVVFSNAVE